MCILYLITLTWVNYIRSEYTSLIFTFIDFGYSYGWLHASSKTEKLSNWAGSLPKSKKYILKKLKIGKFSFNAKYPSKWENFQKLEGLPQS